MVGLRNEKFPGSVQLIWDDNYTRFEFVDPDTYDVYQVAYRGIDDGDPKFRLVVRDDRWRAISGEYDVAIFAPKPQNLPIVDPSDSGKSLVVDENGKWAAFGSIGNLYQVHTTVEPGAGLEESFNDIKAAVEAGKAVYFVRYVIYNEYDEYEATEGMFVLSRLAYNPNGDFYSEEFGGVGNYSTYQFNSYNPDDPMFEPGHDDMD